MLADAHTHFSARPFFTALAALSPRPGSEEERLARLAAESGIEVPGPDLDAHLARWVAQWDHHGVARAVVFASVPEEAPAVAAAARRAGGRLLPYAVVNPAAPDARARARELLEQGGFRGLVFFPALHHYRISSPEARAVLAELAAHGGVAVVHAGALVVRVRDLLGLPRTQDLAWANPLDLVPAASAYPQVPFVVPHFGAGLLRETLLAGSMCPNVHVDTSSSNAWIATQPARLTLAEVFARTLGVLGPERVLFGTDSSTFPRGWRRDVLDAQVAALEEAGASAAERRLVLGENLLRILGEGAPATAPVAGAREGREEPWSRSG